MRVTSSVKAKTACSFSVNRVVSLQAGKTYRRCSVSPFFRASAECIFKQKAQPLICEVRILMSSSKIGSSLLVDKYFSKPNIAWYAAGSTFWMLILSSIVFLFSDDVKVRKKTCKKLNVV